MKSKEQDGVKSFLAFLIAAAVLFLIASVLLCIYSRAHEVKLYISKPLCLIPFALMGVGGGVFLGLDNATAVGSKPVFTLFGKLMWVALLIEIIRSIATDGFDALNAFLEILADYDEPESYLILYYMANIITAAAVILAALFLVRIIARAVFGTGNNGG